MSWTFRVHCRHIFHLKAATFFIPSPPCSSAPSSAPVPLVQREWQGLLDGGFHVAAPAHAIVPAGSKVHHILRVCLGVIDETVPPPVQHRPTVRYAALKTETILRRRCSTRVPNVVARWQNPSYTVHPSTLPATRRIQREFASRCTQAPPRADLHPQHSHPRRRCSRRSSPASCRQASNLWVQRFFLALREIFILRGRVAVFYSPSDGHGRGRLRGRRASRA